MKRFKRDSARLISSIEKARALAWEGFQA